jgi:hypothetical protein
MDEDDNITNLQSEIIALVRTLEDIEKLNTLGKTKQIADEIRQVLTYYNYNK